MKRAQIHLMPAKNPRKGRWQIKVGGSVLFHNDYKHILLSRAIDLAKTYQPSQLFIHGLDGKIQEERTYPRSSDPRRYKG